MEDLLLKGIKDGEAAFIGPEIVQFDLTNRCNNNCICCWTRSPLLGALDQQRIRENNDELPLSLVTRTLQELKEMGTKKIFLAGGGEPFAHPDIMKILRCAKDNNMRVFINTNFTLIDKKRAQEIVDLKIDLIHVSLLSGMPKTYAAVHPNKTADTFNKIKETLKYLVELRRERKQETPLPLPHIDLYNVIFKANFRDIKAMVDVGLEIGANSIEFTPVDTIPGKTDSLLLNRLQKWLVLLQVISQSRRLAAVRKRNKDIPLFIEQYNSFKKRLSNKKADQGQYEEQTAASLPCYVGWAFARILANGNVNPCLKAHKISVGNIYSNSFSQIWNSPQQREFRAKAFTHKSSDPYFNLIGNDPHARFGCIKSCDNIQINHEMHAKYAQFLKK